MQQLLTNFLRSHGYIMVNPRAHDDVCPIRRSIAGYNNYIALRDVREAVQYRPTAEPEDGIEKRLRRYPVPLQCLWVNCFVTQEHRYTVVGSSSEGLHIANRTRCSTVRTRTTALTRGPQDRLSASAIRWWFSITSCV